MVKMLADIVADMKIVKKAWKSWLFLFDRVKLANLTIKKMIFLQSQAHMNSFPAVF